MQEKTNEGHFRAFCSSLKCNMLANNKRYGLIEKDMPKTKAICPDCGSAVFWKRKGKKRAQTEKLKQDNPYKKEYLW